jgi:hypothetical protein
MTCYIVSGLLCVGGLAIGMVIMALLQWSRERDEVQQPPDPEDLVKRK